jgi:BirA family biotin operon repressor/biotin-[acetyl-CoA-carboxylase] ligase
MDTPGELVHTVRLDAVDSTNLLARREIESGVLFHDGAAHARMYVAAEQTGGIGRHGRPWFSPKGGLWTTLVWPVVDGESPDSSEIAAGLGLRVGVVCMSVIAECLTRRMSRVMPQLKWPNDVLLKRRKVCGSLCEAMVTPEGFSGHAKAARTTWFIVGVGINVNNDVSELPDDLRRQPIALRDCTSDHAEIDLDELLRSLRAGLVHALTTPGVDEHTLRLARERLYGAGTTINIVSNDGLVSTGTLVGLSDAGAPILRTGEIEFEVPPGTELQ